MARAVVGSVIRLEEAALAPKSVALLERALTFPNPEYVKRTRLQLWTGATPEEVSVLEHPRPGELVVPRGAVGALRDAARATDTDVIFEDHRLVREPLDLPFELTLRDYQDEAARSLVRHTQGYVVVPCGGGKSRIGAAAIARCRQPAIVLVHTHDLLEQWRATLREAFGVEPGVVAEGSVAPARVTVGMIQTLAAMKPLNLVSLARSFGTVVVDEVHHVPASSFRRVLGAMPARFRFGLTATPERADGLTPLLGFCLGPQVFSIGHRQLVDAGHLVVPEVKTFKTGVSPKADNHIQLLRALSRDPGRNRLIVGLVADAVRDGHIVLVLSGLVEHCELLAKMLGEAGVETVAMTGRLTRGVRSRTVARMRAGTLRAICATALADEGLDVTRLDRVVLATPLGAEGRTIQRLGRLMRPHPDKGTPVLVDLVDDHTIALRQHAARRRAFRKVLECRD